MNTGIGDAVDRVWKLAALLNGWGGPTLLESYDVERRQIAQRNRVASERHMGVRIEIAGSNGRSYWHQVVPNGS